MLDGAAIKSIEKLDRILHRALTICIGIMKTQ